LKIFQKVVGGYFVETHCTCTPTVDVRYAQREVQGTE